MRRLSVYSLLLSTLMLTFCSQTPVSDGSSTETGNVKAGITGTVIDSDSTFISNAFVYVRPSDYKKPIEDSAYTPIIDDTTEVNGAFYYESNIIGIYAVTIKYDTLSAMVYCTLATDSSVVSLPLIKMEANGSCSGEVILSGGDDNVNYDEIFIRWLGTDILTRVNRLDGTFSTTGISAGIYKVEIYPAYYPDMAVVVDNVTIVSGEETIMDPVMLTFGDG